MLTSRLTAAALPRRRLLARLAAAALPPLANETFSAARERFDRQLIEQALAQCGGKVVEATGVRDFFREPAHAYSRALLAATPKYTDPAAGLQPVPDAVIAQVRAEVAAFDRGGAHG